MPEPTFDRSAAGHARAAGVGYLVIIVTGIFAEFFVRSSLIVPGDAAATAANIVASQSLYRVGLIGELLMLACDVMVALALYVIFEPVSRSLSLLAAFFRLVHAAIVGVNLLNTWVPLALVGDAGFLTAFEPAQLHALALLFLEAHAYGYVIGLAFFGVHCLLLGYLVIRSRYVPRILGLLLLAASLGYMTDSVGRTLLPNYDDVASVFGTLVLVPAFVGELSFCLWLLLKGVAVPGSASPRPAPAA
jgi:hypothetical protein